MSLFHRRRPASILEEDRPLSMHLILVMLGVIGVLGYVVLSEAHIPSYVLGLGCVLGGTALFFVSQVRPEITLYLLAAYLPFSKQLAGDFGGLMTALNLTNIFLVIVIWNWFVSAGSSRGSMFEPNRMHLPVVFMALWSFFSFMAAGAKYGSGYLGTYFSEYKRWLDPIICYFVFFHLVKDRQRWKNLIIIFMISVTVVACMAIWEYRSLAGASSLESSRVYGIADNPNSLGAFFVYYMFLFTGFWLHRMNRPRMWLLLIPFLLCFRGIMVTFSRGAYLAFGAGCLGLSFLRSKALFLLTCGILAFTLVNPWLLPAGIRYRLESTFKNKNTEITDTYGGTDLEKQVDTSSGKRLLIWEGARKMIAEYPVFGVGLGQFQANIAEYAPVGHMDAHNAYILTAAELGIPMLIGFIAMFLMLWWTTYEVYRKHTDFFIKSTALGCFGGFTGLALANVFGSRLNSSEVAGYFWILAALMARALAWAKEEAGTERGRKKVAPVIVRTGLARGMATASVWRNAPPSVPPLGGPSAGIVSPRRQRGPTKRRTRRGESSPGASGGLHP